MNKKKTTDGINVLVKGSKNNGGNNVLNKIEINIPKARTQTKKPKENLDLAEEKLQDLETADLEYSRRVLPYFSNPNVYGFNRTDLQNIQQQQKAEEEEQQPEETSPEQPENTFFRNANPVQVGRSGLSLYQQQYDKLLPKKDDFQERQERESQFKDEYSETEPDRLNRLARELKQAKKEAAKMKRKAKAEEKAKAKAEEKAKAEAEGGEAGVGGKKGGGRKGGGRKGFK
ncbi:MAG: hypothetical protein EBU93_04640 [Chlamydiae bacterium]|nr:hypothetical protein [Chlamydiota bacterium]